MGTVCGEGNLEGRSPWGSSSCMQREHRAIQSYKHMQRNHFIRKGHFDPRVFIGLQNPPTVLSSPTRAEDGIYPQGSKVFIKPKKYVSHISPRNGDVWQVLGKNVFCCRLNIFKHFLGRFFFYFRFLLGVERERTFRLLSCRPVTRRCQEKLIHSNMVVMWDEYTRASSHCRKTCLVL